MFFHDDGVVVISELIPNRRNSVAIVWCDLRVYSRKESGVVQSFSVQWYTGQRFMRQSPCARLKLNLTLRGTGGQET